MVDYRNKLVFVQCGVIMIIELNGVRPTIAEDAYLAPTAVLIVQC